MLSIYKWIRDNINYFQYRKCNWKRNLVYEMRVFIGMVPQVMEPIKNTNVKVDVVDDDDDHIILYIRWARHFIVVVVVADDIFITCTMLHTSFKSNIGLNSELNNKNDVLFILVRGRCFIFSFGEIQKKSYSSFITIQ